MYREKYQANLKRDLPHIPYTPDFWAFANAGAQLADIHVTYESQPIYDGLTIHRNTGHADRLACGENEIV